MNSLNQLNFFFCFYYEQLKSIKKAHVFWLCNENS